MTRINIVPPEELCDQHLLAEYRELPRVRKLHPRTEMPEIDDYYVLGKGHVLFFADKGYFLQQRMHEIVTEMRRRGFKPSYTALDLDHWPDEAMNHWTPSWMEKQYNRQRIGLRLREMKRTPTWSGIGEI